MLKKDVKKILDDCVSSKKEKCIVIISIKKEGPEVKIEMPADTGKD